MKLSPFPIPLPPPDQQITDKSGAFTDQGRKFLEFIWNRTGGGSGVIPSLGEELVATGNSQATGLVLEDDWNFVVTGTGLAVVIPDLQGGQSIMIYNEGPNNLEIFPSPGVVIDSLGVNNMYGPMVPNRMQFFFAKTDTQLLSMRLG